MTTLLGFGGSLLGLVVLIQLTKNVGFWKDDLGMTLDLNGRPEKVQWEEQGRHEIEKVGKDV